MMKPPPCPLPDPHPRTPKNAIPPGACDCHLHIFDVPSPQVAARSYTASPAPLADYRKVQRALGLDRAVIVQPSIYGTDNRTTLQALPSDGSMKAIAVVDDDVSLSQLQSLAANGAVGARVNMLFSSDAKTDNLTSLADKLAQVNWHLQILADVSALPNLAQLVTTLPVPVVFDHMGHLPAGHAIDDPGFQTLLKLLDQGQVWVKLSGVYRLTQNASGDYSDVAPMAKALVKANPDRLVWGSDWPHPAFDGHMPNDGDLLDALFDWATPEDVHKILVQNPEQLYGFPRWEDQHA